MENLKHTKEYAEKLAMNLYYISKIENYEVNGYIAGYTKAIEETAAPEMLEALIEAQKELEYHNWQNTKTYNQVTSAITKATK